MKALLIVPILPILPILLALLGRAAPALAAPNQLTPEEKAAGWRLLFDGKTPQGWRGYKDQHFPAHGWKIEDGTLHCEKSNGRPNGGGGDLVTTQRFDDFELRWEWKLEAGGNSGLKYFVVARKLGTGSYPKMFGGDDGTALVGLEYQMLDDGAHPDAKNGPSRTTGALYTLLAPQASEKQLHPPGQWNESRLVVLGTKVEHWLNGHKVVIYNLADPTISAAIAASKYGQVPGVGQKAPTLLLLQDHGFDVWFRNLKLRPLPAK
jgi:hypothetical protein